MCVYANESEKEGSEEGERRERQRELNRDGDTHNTEADRKDIDSCSE